MIEETEGFEDHADDLKAFRLDYEARMEKVYEDGRRRRFFEEPAHAAPASFWHDGSQEHALQPGITKREYFTAMAMQGLCAKGFGEGKRIGADVIPWVAQNAVAIADATLQYLYDDNQ